MTNILVEGEEHSDGRFDTSYGIDTVPKDVEIVCRHTTYWLVVKITQLA